MKGVRFMSIQYSKFAFNSFKVVPRVQNVAYKNYMLDLLPTMNYFVARQYVKAETKMQEKLKAEKGTSGSYTYQEALYDRVLQYTGYETGTSRTALDYHDAMLNLLGFSDWSYESNEGLASLYGSFSKLEPTRCHKDSDDDGGYNLVVKNTVSNQQIVRQYLFTRVMDSDVEYPTWYTPTLCIMQPESALRMTSVLFYATLKMYEELGDMSEFYEVSGSSWLQFLWIYWLKNVAKKLYPCIEIPEKYSQYTNFDTIQETISATDEQFCTVLSMYNPQKSKFPKNTLLIIEALLSSWLNAVTRPHDKNKISSDCVDECWKIYKDSDLKISGSGEIISALPEVDNKRVGKSAVKNAALAAIKLDGILDDNSSLTFSGTLSDKADRVKVKFTYRNPDKETLKYSSAPLSYSDVPLIMSYYAKTLVPAFMDTYRSMILPNNTQRHLGFYGCYIMPSLAELELNRQLSDKRINSLNDTIAELKEKAANAAPVVTKSRDDKMREYYEEALIATEKDADMVRRENETLRDHIAYLESCIKDAKVIEESKEAFKVPTFEEKCESIKNSGKRIILVGAHKINDLEKYTGEAIEQRYDEDLVKIRNGMKMNKNVYDYVFINTRAVSHSTFFGIKSDYKDNATEVVSISVSNARLVVDAVYAEIFES
jgi:hypothetical protein